MPKKKTPKEPRAIQVTYMRELRMIWGLAQGVISQGLDPLLRIWPSDAESRIDSESVPKSFPEYILDANGNEYNPLRRQPQSRRISQMSDADIRRLWPGLNPSDVREYAPWATSEDTVRRAVFPGRSPSQDDLESYVRRSIEYERATNPRNVDIPNQASPPGSTSFIARPNVLPPVILGPNGLPMSPPLPRWVNQSTITRQFGWIRIVLGELLTEENINEIISPSGQKVNKFVAREIGRLLSIRVRDVVPGIQEKINIWRRENVNLIKSATHGPDNSIRLSPLYEDLSELIETAHRQGMRVEQLSSLIRERYGVSDSRANLIARDQILKLNAQITRERQLDVGITKYKWITSRDERVRDGHRKLHGKIFSWDDPPDVGRGEHAHPGMSYQCRCTASPVVEGID